MTTAATKKWWATSGAILLAAGLLTLSPITANAADTITNTINVGTGPDGVAISSDGTYAYVANYGSNTVSKISKSTSTGTATTLVSDNPQDVKIEPDDTHAYVASYASSSVSRISAANATVGKKFTSGDGPTAITMSPDGTYAYVTDAGGGTISQIATGESPKPASPVVTNVTGPDRNGANTFNGTGISGSAVVIKDANGNSVSTVTTDSTGKWSGEIPAGTKTPLSITQKVNGVASDPITYNTAPPPAINASLGGAAILAAAITVSMIRRHRNTAGIN